jgi:hypothetical protein
MVNNNMYEELLEHAEAIVTLLRENPTDELFVIEELAQQLKEEISNLEE